MSFKDDDSFDFNCIEKFIISLCGLGLKDSHLLSVATKEISLGEKLLFSGQSGAWNMDRYPPVDILGLSTRPFVLVSLPTIDHVQSYMWCSTGRADTLADFLLLLMATSNWYLGLIIIYFQIPKIDGNEEFTIYESYTMKIKQISKGFQWLILSIPWKILNHADYPIKLCIIKLSDCNETRKNASSYHRSLITYLLYKLLRF